jgi:hypothetical protein
VGERFAFIEHLVTQHESFKVAPLCRRYRVWSHSAVDDRSTLAFERGVA